MAKPTLKNLAETAIAFNEQCRDELLLAENYPGQVDTLTAGWHEMLRRIASGEMENIEFDVTTH